LNLEAHLHREPPRPIRQHFSTAFDLHQFPVHRIVDCQP
jgi:hypothetical protein